MYCEDFASIFFEFLHEYSDNPEMLNTIRPFIQYGWGTYEINGNKANANTQREFIQWMAENNASVEAIKAAINLMTE